MGPMRTAVLALILVAAASAVAAQPATQFELDNLRAQQQDAQRRSIDLDNQLQARDARERADAAARSADIQRGPIRAPELRYEYAPQSGAVVTGKYPSVPDAVLADSNRRVQDAAKNRR